jgi:hypothetical protein
VALVRTSTARLARGGRLTTATGRLTTSARRPAPLISPLQVHGLVHGDGQPMPDPIEWVVSDKYLDRGAIFYPRQATILKVMFLRDDMFTQYDHDVIGGWERTFQQTGNEGISPGIYDRIRICKEQGRSWFRETLGVIGRRGSKGYIGGLSLSYVLWNYMHRPGGPQKYYGIDRDKRLTAIVFAGKKEQAVANQWRDIYNVIMGGPCFAPYISSPQAERLTVFAPSDMLRAQRAQLLGLETDQDMASFEIVPSASTLMAGRGWASFAQIYDEMAHVTATGSNRDAEAIYGAATPSLDQFGKDAFLYEPSSPWTMTGQFYANWEKAIKMEPDGSPAFPNMLMLQLPSWGTYEDWDEADRIPLMPPKKAIIEVQVEIPREDERGRVITTTEIQQVETLVAGPTFNRLERAIQAYDEDLQLIEKANPDTFAVERRSHWAESLVAYLNRDKVREVFEPWRGRTLTVQSRGALAMTYMAHGDPATSNKRFGWALGHAEFDPETNMHHAVIDVIRCWEPGDYEDHLIDYDDVMDDIEVDVKGFVPELVSFDQFNVPATIGRLRKFVAKNPMPKNVIVSEVTRTRPLNWRHFELFKSAINMGLVHAPMIKGYDADGEPEVNYASEQGELELRFLEEKNGAVDHPTSGPVQSKDIADAIVETTVALIGEQMATFLGQTFAEAGVSASAPGGFNPYKDMDPTGGASSGPAEALGGLMSGRGRAGMVQPRSRGGMRQR